MINDTRLVVQTKPQSPDAISQTFESFAFELGRLYQICLVHYTDRKSSSSIELYVNGEFIESRSTRPILASAHRHQLKFNLQIDGSSETDNVIPEIISSMIINSTQSREWILLSHSLGPNYSGTYQDPNLISLLDPKTLMKLRLKLRENLEDEEKTSNDLHLLEKAHVDSHKIVLNFHCMNYELMADMVKINIQTMAKSPQPILFRSDKILFYNPISINNTLFSIGGFGIVLRLVAESNTTDHLVNSLQLLFHVLESDPRSLAEFGSKSGYDVLATLLKTKKSLIKMDVLMSILEFIGYNEDSPVDSIIANKLAYCTLISDFEIWQPQRLTGGHIDPASKDTFKFVLFQLSMFGDGSKYHSYNLKKLDDMKIVKRVIQALKYRLVDDDLLPILHDSLLILVRQNPTTDIIKAMSLYVVYALAGDSTTNSKNCGISILDIIVSLICDPIDFISSDAFKQVLKCINAKWLMILLDHDDPKVVKLALQLLLRVLSLLGPRAQRAFNESGGLIMLRKCLSKDWYDNDIMIILLCGAFGVRYSHPDIIEFIQKLPTDSNVVMNGLLLVINGMLETCINDIQDVVDSVADVELNETVLNGINFLGSYAQVLELLLKKDCDFRWITEVMLIVLSLEKIEELGPTIPSISTLTANYRDLLASFFLQKLLGDKPSGRDYIKKIVSHEKDLFSLAVMPSILDHINQSDKSILKDQDVCCSLLRLITVYLQMGQGSLEIIGSILFKVENEEYLAKSTTAFKSCRSQFATSYLTFFVKSTSPHMIRFYCSLLMTYERIICYGLDDLSVLVSILFEDLLSDDDEVSSLSANCLRMIAMDSGLSINKEQGGILSKSTSRNDEELRSLVYSDRGPKDMLSSKTSTELPGRRSSSVLIDTFKDGIQNQHLKRWNLESIAKAIVDVETKKFNRHIQDDKDDLAYYISMYDKIRSRIPVDDLTYGYYLDSTEGRYRMHKKMLRKPILESMIQLDDGSAGDAFADSAPPEMDTSGYEFVSEQTDLSTFQEDKNRKVIRSLYVHDKIVQIYNTTQILGLETFESILIIGLTHFYLAENYFHTADGDIVDINDAPESERDAYVKIIRHSSANDKATSHNTKSWPMDQLISASKRKFLLRDVAIELFFTDGGSVLLTCGNRSLRNSLFGQLSSKITAKYTDEDLEEAMKLASRQKITFMNRGNQDGGKLSSMLFNTFINSTVPPSANASMSKITKKWKRGELSNFYYLMLINTIAGRTTNDLTQYPVFPFVIADYESEELDLDDPATFRDLSKPMGAQTPRRATQYQERYNACAEIAPDLPPAHYGTHYSSAMVVASYLIRLEPFVRSYLIVQDGKFDHADRLFYSMERTWKSASSDNTSDVRELIPEFYYLPEFLVNSNHFDFGTLQDGTPVNDVELPPWAKNDPLIFVQKMRQALESSYVSEHLPDWIDLVFGYKQKGPEAAKALNVFHHLSYAGAIDLDTVEDDRERTVVISTIHNFGQTPLQIFNKPHPKRWKKLPSFHFNPAGLVIPVSTEKDAGCKRNDKMSVRRYSSCNLILNESMVFEQLSQGKITRFELLGEDNLFAVGFDDGSILVYKLTANTLNSITNSQRSSIQYSRIYPTSQNPNCLELQNIDVMRGHSDGIKDMKISHYNGVMVTLSKNGEVILWNLADYDKIRDISMGRERLIGISDEEGYIGTIDDEEWLRLYTINGEMVDRVKLKEGATVVEFSERDKVDNIPWKEVALIAVGFKDGSIEMYELKLGRYWMMSKIGEMRVEGEIAGLQFRLGVSLNGEGEKVGRGYLTADLS
ncbi:DEKNAAC103984 [Brettanomyces naardenensis]|uniref:Beige protein homolog 1 n=1 Tax=Brettanomyces naardenensis TaxID=13370 RepID=A0A448YPT3_BRENA|nr:DEKNAAC103984 [Brettanomyces naardenensis]